MIHNSNKKGFTLLELLIVIAIIGALSVIIIFLLDPTETLKKSRDVQRMSDLGTLKTAIGLYLTSTSTPYLAGAASNTACKTGTGGGTYTAAEDRIYYSIASSSANITDTTLDNTTFSAPGGDYQAETIASSTLVDGTGWLPVNLDGITGGSPISSLPLDPVNALGAGDSVTSISSSTLAYRYACNGTSKTFEIDAVLESNAYTIEDNKLVKDGGNNSNFYEVGSNIKILGSGGDF